MRSLPRLLMAAIADQFVLVSIVSFLGVLHWSFDLPAHFRPQLAFVAVLVALVAFILKLRRRAALCLVMAIFHAVPLMPYLFPQADAGQPSLRVMTANLQHVHVDVQKFHAEVKKENPDILLLTEMQPDVSPLLSGLEASYPYRVEYPRQSLLDVMLLSRWPVKEHHVHRGANVHLPVLSALVCKDETRCIHVVGMHVTHALNERDSISQRSQLDAAIAMVKPGQPTLMMGDFNITPWSATFQDLLKRTGLHDSATSRFLTATWPVPRPLLVIDHVLISAELSAVASRVGGPIGSDHFPVIADLAWRKP